MRKGRRLPFWMASIALGSATWSTLTEANTLEACRTVMPFDKRVAECTAFLAKVKGKQDRAAGLVERGIAKFRLGDRAGALADYDAAQALTPDDPYVFNNRGIVFFDQGQNDRALGQVDQAIKLRADVTLFRRNRGRILAALGRHADAMVEFNEALARDPKDGWSYRERARSYVALKDDARALEDMVKAGETLKFDADLLIEKAVIQKRLKQYSDAAKTCKAATEASDKSAAAWECYADAVEQTGDNYGAREAYQKAVALNPKFALAYAGLGDVLRKLSKFSEAVDAYARAIELDAGYTYALENRARALEKLERWTEARGDYDLAVSKRPDNWTAKRERALVVARLGGFTQALRDLDAYVAANPKSAAGLLARAEVHEAYGDWRKALDDFSMYLTLVPDDVSALVSRGKLRANLGDDVLALADFERASELKPSDYSAWRALLDHYTKRGEMPVLLRRLGQKLIIKPDDAVALERRIHVLKDLGRIDEMVSDLRQLAVLKVNDEWDLQSTRLEIAEALAGQSKFDEALQVLDEALPTAKRNYHRARILYTRGGVKMAAGRSDEGLKDVMASLDIEPDAAPSVLRAVPKANRAATAEAIVARLLQLQAQKPSASTHKALADILAELKRNEEALIHFDAAIAAEPKDVWIRVNAARLLKRSGEPQKALERLSALIAAHDASDMRYGSISSALRERAEIYRDLGRLDEALADLRNPIGSSNLANRYLGRLPMLLDVHRRRGTLAELRDELTAALAEQPRWVDVLDMRAGVQRALGQFDAAVADAGTILDIRPTDTSALDLRAGLQAQRGQYAASIADRQKSSALAPKDASKLINLGDAYATVGDRMRAAEAYQQAAEADPKQPWPHIRLGQLAQTAHDFVAVRASAEKAFALDPNSYSGLVLRARANRADSQFDAARADLERAIAMSPNFTSAYTERGFVHAAAGDAAAAAADHAKAWELTSRSIGKPDLPSPVQLGYRAWLKHHQGDQPAALGMIERALEVAPSVPDLIELRGMVFQALGRREEAIADFRRALSKDAKRGDSLRALAELTR